MFGRYARFMFAPDDGASGGGVGSERLTAGAETKTAADYDTTDYKALYEKEVAERAKLKKSFDATASEIAELKKANKAKMSEEEKREAELAERELHYKEMENQLNSMRVDTVFAKNGYDEKDYSDLSKKLVEVCGANASELAEVFLEFVKKANKTAVANAKNGMIKDSAIPPKASNTTEERHIYANMALEANRNEKNIESIKNKYSR